MKETGRCVVGTLGAPSFLVVETGSKAEIEEAKKTVLWMPHHEAAGLMKYQGYSDEQIRQTLGAPPQKRMDDDQRLREESGRGWIDQSTPNKVEKVRDRRRGWALSQLLGVYAGTETWFKRTQIAA